MTGALGDIAELEQVALVDLGIEFGLAPRVAEVARPAHEMGNRTDRPITVEHLEAEITAGEVALDTGERIGGAPRQQAAWLLVTRNPVADEIVGPEIAHVDHESRNHGGSIDEVFMLPLLGQRR